MIPRCKEKIRSFDAGDFAAWKAKAIIDDGLERHMYREDPEAVTKILKSMAQLETIISTNYHATMGFSALLNTCKMLKAPKRSKPFKKPKVSRA